MEERSRTLKGTSLSLTVRCTLHRVRKETSESGSAAFASGGNRMGKSERYFLRLMMPIRALAW